MGNNNDKRSGNTSIALKKHKEQMYEEKTLLYGQKVKKYIIPAISLLVIGGVITAISYSIAGSGGTYWITSGAFLFGFIYLLVSILYFIFWAVCKLILLAIKDKIVNVPALNNNLNEINHLQPTKSSAITNNDIPMLIKKINILYKQEIISEEEYNAKKAELLKRL